MSMFWYLNCKPQWCLQDKILDTLKPICSDPIEHCFVLIKIHHLMKSYWTELHTVHTLSYVAWSSWKEARWKTCIQIKKISTLLLAIYLQIMNWIIKYPFIQVHFFSLLHVIQSDLQKRQHMTFGHFGQNIEDTQRNTQVACLHVV